MLLANLPGLRGPPGPALPSLWPSAVALVLRPLLAGEPLRGAAVRAFHRLHRRPASSPRWAVGQLLAFLHLEPQPSEEAWSLAVLAHLASANLPYKYPMLCFCEKGGEQKPCRLAGDGHKGRLPLSRMILRACPNFAWEALKLSKPISGMLLSQRLLSKPISVFL